MALAAGTRLGSYEVHSLIGAGGMGEVYKARDTQLKRDVALKILPADLALEPERLARFDREAQALAALNHPHIAQIHGFVHEGDVRAIVMELVDGPTLAERIARGPVPIDQALPLASQLADALEYAHERGIIHRDLKPANIKLTEDGAVKVLDFGLAKVLAGEAIGSAGDPLGTSPTMMSPARLRQGYGAAGTEVGIILGTAAYMSPEQARGAAVDKRADIWAFGAVLFEMLTGKVSFAGETVTDVLAAVVKTEPDWSALPRGTPRRLRELLQRCLTKDRKERLRDIGDARVELERSQARASVETDGGLDAEVSARRVKLAFVFGGACLVALLAGVTALLSGFWPRARPAEGALPIVFHIMPPAGFTIPARVNAASISPDGRAVAFVGEKDGKSGLWIRPIDAADAAAWPVPGSEGAVAAPFWRPDGAAFAFAIPGELRRVEMASRAPRLVCALPVSTDPDLDGAWSPTNEIVFGVSGASSTLTGQLFHVPAAGGRAVALTPAATHDQPIWLFPQFTRAASLLTLVGNMRDQFLHIGTPDAPSARRAATPVWGRISFASGYLVYGREDALVAQRMDEASAGVNGEPQVITSGVQYEHLYDLMLAAFSVSQNGTLLYRQGSQKLGRFSIVDRAGNPIRDSVGEGGEYVTFTVSDDGRTIVAGRGEPDKHGIWKIETASGNVSLLAPTTQYAGDPSLGRPGFVTFDSDLDRREMWEVPLGGGAPTRLPLAGEVFHDRTRDGSWLLVGELTSLRVVSATDPSRVVPLVNDGRHVDQARFSPDGGAVAYNENRSGRYEVWVVSNPPTGDKRKVSIAGGVQPSWRADGRELYYLALDGTLMAVDMHCPAKRPCSVGIPHALFATGIPSPSTQIEDYASTANGQRFVILRPSGQVGPLTVLLNWPEIVKKK